MKRAPLLIFAAPIALASLAALAALAVFGVGRGSTHASAHTTLADSAHPSSPSAAGEEGEAAVHEAEGARGSEPPAQAEAPNVADDESAGELRALEREPEPAKSKLEVARELRLPVIQAIRGDFASPEARHDAMLDALRRSGESREPWTSVARDVYGKWNEALPADPARRVDWRSVQCYRAGCEVRMSFADRKSYESAAAAFRSIREDAAPHGGRVQTPPVVEADGTVSAAWILLRPDSTES
ncbi:hypothetical protein [Pendulispora albinea]|uniref:Uncharacterized protein n=1 Tax=Pendulispora albinea TaxID=2741071 RepID=A0ABZ2M0B1_9BACT